MKRLSRFLSVRLSVFLVLVSAACLAVGIFAERWHRRQRAAAVIQEYRGRIHWSTDDPSLVWFRRAERIYLSSKRSPDAQRRTLSEARQQLDKAFSALKGFPELQELSVDDPAFDDTQLQHVSRLHNLRSLYLGGDCAVTGSGLQYLQKLPLRELDIQRPLSGDSLNAVAELHSLESLRLACDNDVTGQELLTLASLSGLTDLCLFVARPNQIPTDAVERLKSRMPDCDISVVEPDDLLEAQAKKTLEDIVWLADHAVLEDVTEGRYRDAFDLATYIMGCDSGLPAGHPAAIEFEGDKQAQVRRIREALEEATGEEWDELVVANDVSKSE